MDKCSRRCSYCTWYCASIGTHMPMDMQLEFYLALKWDHVSGCGRVVSPPSGQNCHRLPLCTPSFSNLTKKGRRLSCAGLLRATRRNTCLITGSICIGSCGYHLGAPGVNLWSFRTYDQMFGPTWALEEGKAQRHTGAPADEKVCMRGKPGEQCARK